MLLGVLRNYIQRMSIRLGRVSWFCGLFLKEVACSVMWDISAELQVAEYGIFLWAVKVCKSGLNTCSPHIVFSDLVFSIV